MSEHLNGYLETIAWQPTAKELPDADETVLVQFDTDEISLGYLDGEVWRSEDAMRFTAKVLAWAQLPAGIPAEKEAA